MASLLKKLNTDNQQLNQIQDFTATVVNPLVKRPWIGDSVLLEDVTLTYGAVNYVEHKLGRTLRGWEIVRRKARSGGYDEKIHLVGATGEPAFQNSWVNYGAGAGDAGFVMGADGYVTLFGRVKNGSAIGATQITLPAGYRPNANLTFAVSSQSAFGSLEAQSAGNVVAQAGTTLGMNWDGIRFAAVSPYHAGAEIFDQNSDTTIGESFRQNFLLLFPKANCTVDIVVW